MKASNVYLKAARLIESGEREASCCAVLQAYYGAGKWVAQSISANQYCRTYTALMNNGYEHMTATQFDEAEDHGFGSARNLRILALCFMAAIAEDEERSRKRRS